MGFNFRRLPVVKRVIPSLWRRLRRLVAAEPFGVYRYFGVPMLLNPENFTDRQIVYFRDCERRQIEALTARLSEQGCDLFLDIGAHKGLYSLIVDHKRLARRIVAFEPDLRNWRNLQANLLLNDAGERIEVFAKAVAARSGPVSFAYASSDKTGRSRVVDADTGRTVEAIALDDILDNRGLHLAAKIDVEGYQLEVLRGMQGLLTGNRCLLQVEANDQVAEALIAYLAGLGFQHTGQIGIDHYFENAPGPENAANGRVRLTPATARTPRSGSAADLPG
jgi:FkbM family methyltransferase